MSMLIAPSLPPICIDSDLITGNAKLVASSARMIDSLLLTAGGGAAVVSLYDSIAEVADPNKLRIQIAANQGESTPYCPVKSMPFENGVYIVFEQGGKGQGGASLTLQID